MCLLRCVRYFRCLFWYALLNISLSYSIHNFVIHETRSGTLLELVRLNNSPVFNDIINTTSPVTVILLTNNPSENFHTLRSLLPAEINYFNDRRDVYKVKTPQLHVLIQPTHSTVLPGFIKFMIPIKKMNSTDAAKFVKLSMEIEKYIISPNIDKVLCYPNQQVILMNTILGNYRSFTMYVASWDGAKNVRNLTDGVSGKRRNSSAVSRNSLAPAIAKELLNPISCDVMFHGIINIDV